MKNHLEQLQCVCLHEGNNSEICLNFYNLLLTSRLKVYGLLGHSAWLLGSKGCKLNSGQGLYVMTYALNMLCCMWFRFSSEWVVHCGFSLGLKFKL